MNNTTGQTPGITPTSGAADLLAMVSKALREAYNLGQRYWQQADSEYISQHKKADDTRAKFLALVEETCAALAAGQAPAAPAQPDPAYSAACHLATALFKKHFAHLPDFASGQAVWSLCDSTAGVISQIDNMVSGLVQPPTISPQADSVQEDAAWLDWLEQHDGRYYNLDKVASIVGTGFIVQSEGNTPQVHSTLRGAIEAARKQGANHDR